MDKKKIIKIIISIFLFVLGTLGSIFISSYLHLFLTKGLSGIGIFSMLQAIRILSSEKKALNIFMILELGVIALSIFYYFMKDNFYESELMTITPRIKIPVPAGQMQFGSARFINDEEMSNLFTICEVNQKDKLIKKLMEFGVKEYKEIKRVVIQKDEERPTEDIGKFQKNSNYKNQLQKETEKEVEIEETEKEKTYKYRIQEEISLFLEDDTDSLKYYLNEIEEIDKIILLEKDKKYESINEKVELMSKGDDKDKLKEQLRYFKEHSSKDIEEEIEKIEDEEVKKTLKIKLAKLHHKLNETIKNNIKDIEAFLSSLKITEDTNLEEYRNILLNIKNTIEKMPDCDEKILVDKKALDFMEEITQENNRRFADIIRNIN